MSDQQSQLNEAIIMQDIREMRSEVKEFGKSLARVERKVFNGFGTRIDSIKEGLDTEIKNNDKQHIQLVSSVTSMQRFLFGSMVTIFAALLGVFALLYVSSSKTEQHVQRLEDNLIQVLVEQAKTPEEAVLYSDTISTE